ncbi:MAG TPA: hypothetical protein VM513_19200 [Kofleriaceae bacterium]|nr:hypothetical protein [Kofleriaceae bacterium]
MDSDDKPDPKVKDLLGRELHDVVDELTAKELERWFGLPSFTDVEEAAAKAPAPTEDPEIAAVRERRKQATAAVEPALLDAIHARTVVASETLVRFEATIDVCVDAGIARLDLDMIDRRMSIAEPRQLERPMDIEDELRDNTPQALLRDLHRAEIDFDKTFEVVDMAAEQTLDPVAAVGEAMRTNWKLPPLGEPPPREVHRMLAEARGEIRAPWTNIPARVELPNRRVSE